MPCVLLLLAVAVCSAQAPQVVSPEIDEVRTVTFRLHAPYAKSVTLWGEWLLCFNQAEEFPS